MKNLKSILPICLTLLFAGCAVRRTTSTPDQSKSTPLQDIVFGSCLNRTVHPMLDRTLMLPMDLFIFMGDNVYADTTNRLAMRAKYDALKASAFFRTLRAKTPILATWDDHDFGLNDSGSENPIREAAQEEFLNWIEDPPASIRRRRQGIYDAHVFGPAGRRVQVILLDTRFFRSGLKKGAHGMEPSGGPYVPNDDPSATLLGETQWHWLEREFRKPAELRLIISSIQFVGEFCGSEAWANIPGEKTRMIELIRKTNARGTVFLSGDRHWAELSRMDGPLGLPLYDLTASAMTQGHSRGTPSPNRYRFLEKTFHLPNTGVMQIDWDSGDPGVLMSIVDESGTRVLSHRIPFRELGVQIGR